MSIAATCPKCGGFNNMPDDLAGRSGFCSHCGQIIDVPAESVQPESSDIAPPIVPHLLRRPAPIQRKLLLAGILIAVSAMFSLAVIVIGIANWPKMIPKKAVPGPSEPETFVPQPLRLALNEIEVAPGVVLEMRWPEALREPDWFRRELAKTVYELLLREDFAGADADRIIISIDLIGTEMTELLHQDGTSFGEHRVDRLHASVVFLEASGRTLWRNEHLLYPSHYRGIRISEPLLSQTVSEVANTHFRLLAAQAALKVPPPAP